MNGHAVALDIVFGDRGVHFHLVLADLGAVVAALAYDVGLGKTLLHAAQLEQDIALDIVRPMRMDRAGVRRHRLLAGIERGQFAHREGDQADRFLGGRIIDRRDRRDRLPAIAYLVAGQGVLAASDRQHSERLVAVGAGDDRLDAGQRQRLRNVDVENLGVRIGAAVDASGKHSRSDQIGRVLRPSRHFLGSVDHRHIGADGVRRHHLVHGATPASLSVVANFTASMIFT